MLSTGVACKHSICWLAVHSTNCGWVMGTIFSLFNLEQRMASYSATPDSIQWPCIYSYQLIETDFLSLSELHSRYFVKTLTGPKVISFTWVTEGLVYGSRSDISFSFSIQDRWHFNYISSCDWLYHMSYWLSSTRQATRQPLFPFDWLYHISYWIFSTRQVACKTLFPLDWLYHMSCWISKY